LPKKAVFSNRPSERAHSRMHRQSQPTGQPPQRCAGKSWLCVLAQ